jgi:hypothetical protein
VCGHARSRPSRRRARRGTSVAEATARPRKNRFRKRHEARLGWEVQGAVSACMKASNVYTLNKRCNAEVGGWTQLLNQGRHNLGRRSQQPQACKGPWSCGERTTWEGWWGVGRCRSTRLLPRHLRHQQGQPRAGRRPQIGPSAWSEHHLCSRQPRNRGVALGQRTNSATGVIDQSIEENAVKARN